MLLIIDDYYHEHGARLDIYLRGIEYIGDAMIILMIAAIDIADAKEGG